MGLELKVRAPVPSSDMGPMYLGQEMTSVQKSALGVYGVLLLICVGLIVGADFLGPTVRTSVLPIATDGFKTVLGALIGAISTLLGVGRSGS
jgi:hypothetical protein